MAAKRPEDLLLCHVCANGRSEKQILPLPVGRCRMTAGSLRSHQDDSRGRYAAICSDAQ
jgi:hypothetical protein